MSILAECAFCHRKQSVKNKRCRKCQEDLDKQKRSRKVRFWINYRLPGGKQRREPVGYSIKEAQDADGKRRGQKKEGRIFDMMPDSKMTFNELAEWYLGLKSVQRLKSYDRIELALRNFNDVFGNDRVNFIRPLDLENYQAKREEQGRAFGTIDMEVKIAQTMVTKAFDNDKIDGRSLKAFRRVKRRLKKGENARKRTLTIEEYLKLISSAPPHLRAMIVIAFNTGMRAGEIRTLKWSYVDKDQDMVIRLPADEIKEKKAKVIPINRHVRDVLERLPNDFSHDFVITYNGKPIRQKDGYKRSFRTACKAAKISCGRKTPNGITFHDIRRTVKTNMLEAGIDKVHRDVILGHSLQGMDVHYLVPSEEALKSAMKKYTDWLDMKILEAKQAVPPKSNS